MLSSANGFLTSRFQGFADVGLIGLTNSAAVIFSVKSALLVDIASNASVDFYKKKFV